MKARIKQSTIYNLQSTGFSLIEAVVSISVFAIAFTAMIGVFLSIQRLNREAMAIQLLEQNMRFIQEDLSKLIRNGRIDYARYGGQAPQTANNTLYLIDSSGQQVAVFYYDNNTPTNNSDDYIAIERGGIIQKYISEKVLVAGSLLGFQFYINPTTDPFDGGQQEQPVVTVFAFVVPLGVPQISNNFSVMQFTVATRQYSE